MSIHTFIDCPECSSPMFDLGFEHDEPAYYCDKCNAFQSLAPDARAFEMRVEPFNNGNEVVV